MSRRDSQFREFPPASAQYTVVVPYFGDLAIWVRRFQHRGWQFPVGSRKSGETVSDAAKRQLWDSTRIAAPRLDLLGALTQEGKSRVAYVYTCAVSRLPWSLERPTDGIEVGVFMKDPRPIDGDWCLMILQAAHRARKSGLT